MTANYDMRTLRIEHIARLVETLRKDSKFYAQDYENIVLSVNRMTRRQLLESIERHKAISEVSKSEICRNCQVPD